MNNLAFTSLLGQSICIRSTTFASPQVCLDKNIFGARVGVVRKGASSQLTRPSISRVSATTASPSSASIDTYQCPIEVPNNGTVSTPVSTAPVISEGTSVQLTPSFVHHNFHMDATGPAGSHGSLTFNGYTYELDQLHMHNPSENHLDTREFPMEIHLVHKRSGGVDEPEVAVLALLVDYGSFNTEFEKLLDAAQNNQTTTINVRDMLGAGLRREQLLTFWGSLTTDPFTTGIQWILSKEIIHVAPEQVQKYQNTMGVETPNDRDIQKILDRTVTAYY